MALDTAISQDEQDKRTAKESWIPYMQKHTKKWNNLGNWNILVPREEINRESESSGERNWIGLKKASKAKQRGKRIERSRKTRSRWEKCWTKSVHEMRMEKRRTTFFSTGKLMWLIVKSTVRELRRNWTIELHQKSKENDNWVLMV